MSKMLHAKRRSLASLQARWGSLVARSKLAPILGLLPTGIAILIALSSFHRSEVDEVRSAQVILNQIAARTRDINTLTWTALQQQNLTPEADTKMREGRKALFRAVLAAHLHDYHTPALEKVWPVFDSYMM